jgi:hypothetical protein
MLVGSIDFFTYKLTITDKEVIEESLFLFQAVPLEDITEITGEGAPPFASRFAIPGHKIPIIRWKMSPQFMRKNVTYTDIQPSKWWRANIWPVRYYDEKFKLYEQYPYLRYRFPRVTVDQRTIDELKKRRPGIPDSSPKIAAMCHEKNQHNLALLRWMLLVVFIIALILWLRIKILYF